MDILTLFLMQTLRGLQVTEEDLLTLLNLQPFDRLSLENLLKSSPARTFAAENPGWLDDSMSLYEETSSKGVIWSRFGDLDYPQAWLSLSQKPLVFHYLGEPVWKTWPMLSVVGSRTPMHETKMWMQRELGKFLRVTRVGVVSGGARGVDQWAHRLALDCARPTVCILPAGVLRPYPPGSETFMDSLVREGGCVLSTFHPLEDLRKHNFHIRNRWIAGLANVCLVAEANRRSGSSLTATLAKFEGRTVATVPVHPHSTKGLANLDLIGDGAAMIRDHLDLSAVWALNSGPNTFEAVHSESEKDDVNDPETD